MQLAHAVKDANGRAYNRTKYIKQRHKMMQHWSDYLDGLQADNVVAVKFGGVAWVLKQPRLKTDMFLYISLY